MKLVITYNDKPSDTLLVCEKVEFSDKNPLNENSIQEFEKLKEIFTKNMTYPIDLSSSIPFGKFEATIEVDYDEEGLNSKVYIDDLTSISSSDPIEGLDFIDYLSDFFYDLL